MQINKYILAAAAAMGITAAAAAHEMSSLAISDLTVSVQDNALVSLKMDINPAQYNFGRNRELTLQPVIYNADSTSSATLPPIVIAGHDRYLRYVREPGKLPHGAILLRAGRDKTITYSAATEFQPWMQVSTIAMDAHEYGCCGAPERNTSTPAAMIDMRPHEFIAPDFIAEAPPVADSKTIELHGSAFIDFRVNRTEIDPVYRKNPTELAKILATINVVRENPDATITDITIKGYASPEGPYNNNIRLSKGRTVALKDYVMSQYDFPASIFHTDNEPEDWAGFRDSMLISILPNRAGIIELIDSDLAPDAKDAAIKRKFPSDYKYILEYIYPALRHSDYTVRYTIREYTVIDEIRRVMRERPGNLSLREFHLLASSYTPGSDEYNEVFDVAVRCFPDDSTSNINAAAVAINKGDPEAAARFLSRVPGSPAVDYLNGIILARQGNFAAARPLLQTAATKGVPQAAAALDNLSEVEEVSQNTITYLNDNTPKTFTR